MQQAASEAFQFVQNMDEQEFMNNVLVQSAVGMSLMMLGEAVARLAKDNPEFLIEHADMPWREIQGLRNRIAHGYFTIDMNIIWGTAKMSLPHFLDQLHMLHHWRPQGE
jgi:uncharacterized protein with HEPN domain